MTNIYTPVDTAALPAVNFNAPLLNPSPTGLYPVTAFTEEGDGPVRFISEGVRIWPHNYGGAGAFGVWGAGWCSDPGEDLKTGARPSPHDPFAPITVWAYDQCDLTPESETDVQNRVLQNLRLLEQTAVENEVGARMLTDAGSPASATDLADAIGQLEAALAETQTIGVIHANPYYAAIACRFNGLLRYSGTKMITPMGHTWCFGGGYTNALTDTLVATSPVYGWRDDVVVRSTVKVEWNQFVAVAERSVSIGYEACIAAATIS